jgi:hypothetical protein
LKVSEVETESEQAELTKFTVITGTSHNLKHVVMAFFWDIKLHKYGLPTVCSVSLNLLDAAPDLAHSTVVKGKANKYIVDLTTDTVITHIASRPNRTWIRCHEVNVVSY